jgi:hypothetical protein
MLAMFAVDSMAPHPSGAEESFALIERKMGGTILFPHGELRVMS